jgi:hypothetical protein
MNAEKRFRFGIFFLSVLLIASFAWAAEQKVTLKAGPEGKGASGEALIKDKEPGQKEITISAKGLKPNGVYTVWFVKMKPKMDMMGIGTPNYVMKIDEKGDGSYTATVSADELAKWEMIEIAYHKDADPKNMMKMGAALKGGLKMMGKKKKGM